ncbi:unnamed protein product [Diatraea saccharalis]|uniref:Uncharacterized protein n=1 Tax=Diatraea saccharalis TaxID=40085 RepID=A0A9N9R9N0_9NEOP|nr:unnamed protein product [Diatraea saccharalis]
MQSYINNVIFILFTFAVSRVIDKLYLLKFNTYLRISQKKKTMLEVKKKRRQYCAEYIKFGFIENPTNPSSPLCLLCLKTFSNEMKIYFSNKLIISTFESTKKNSFPLTTCSGPLLDDKKNKRKKVTSNDIYINHVITKKKCMTSS